MRRKQDRVCTFCLTWSECAVNGSAVIMTSTLTSAVPDGVTQDRDHHARPLLGGALTITSCGRDTEAGAWQREKLNC